MRTRLAILLAGAVALGGCAYGGYGPYGGMSVGLGYNSGYGGYGDYGYGSGYYGGYGSYYGNGYGYPYGGYGDPYFGWYDSYYYPGTGYYVYDSYRRPHVWTDSQKRYWTDRRNRVLSTGKVKQDTLRQNWSSFDRRTSDGDHDRTRERSGNRHSNRD